jgi:hypothetical protein
VVKVCFENQLRLSESLRDIAEDRLNVRMDIGNVRQRQTKNFVAAQVLMQNRRLGGHGFNRVMDRFHFLIIDGNPAKRLFGDRRRLGRDDRHPLADEAHGLLSQHRHVLQSSADQAARQVIRGENRKDAFDVFRRGGIDAADARVGIGTSQAFAPDHAGSFDIRGVAHGARHFRLTVETGCRSADLGEGVCHGQSRF